MEKVDKTGNQINVIYPYRTKGGWAFDDEEVGLKGEAFIAGMPQIIDELVGDEDTFTAYLSQDPMPDSIVLTRTDDEVVLETSPTKLVQVGAWYEFMGMEGWLCPATLKYFKDYPEKIYVRIEGSPETVDK